MRHFIPDFIGNASRDRKHSGKFQASTIFIDISGFTALTQALMQHGTEGAEVLTDAINRIFAPAINIIYAHGGFVSGFAGDAFTAIFPKKSTTNSSAVASGWEIKNHFELHGTQSTKFGVYPLSVHVGLGKGDIAWKILPHPKQHLYWFCGAAIEECAASEHHAGTNDVICSHEIRTELKADKRFTFKKLAGNFHRVTGCTITETLPKPKHTTIPQAAFVPANIRCLHTAGEFREVVSCFIHLEENKQLSSQMMSIATYCAQFGGYFNKIDFGDKGWMALVLFGAPVAFEKMAQRACDFALAVKSIPGIKYKIGLSFGKAFAGFIGSELRGEYTVIGMSVNLAARFIMAAQWGEVLLDKRIHHEIEHNYVVEQSGEHSLKGFVTPVSAFRLLDKQLSSEQKLYAGQMVGREYELNRLKELCRPVFHRQFGGVVYLYGEAGMGKSRLVWELEEALGDSAQFFTLQTDGILQQPYNPFSYFVRKVFGDLDSGTIEVRRNKFRTNWSEFVRSISLLTKDKTTIAELNRIESVIASLLGLEWENSVYTTASPKDRPALVQTALKELFLAFALRKPVVLLLEDLHWLDNESAEVFQALTHNIKSVPLVILSTSRYRDDGSKPTLPPVEKVPQSVIDLSVFTLEQTHIYLKELLEANVEQELNGFIYGRAEGNPFYTEQLCMHLKETGAIELKNGAYSLANRTLELPGGIDQVLVARIDRLETGLKDTVQIASVLGREFATEVLKELIRHYYELNKITHQTTNHHRIHSHLSSGERERVWSSLSELRYIFSHALLRDAAYNIQLKKRLQVLHKLAAETLLTLFPGDKQKYLEIAEHWEKAEEWRKAVEYYDNAGIYEQEAFRYEQALKYCRKAFEINLATKGENSKETADSYHYLGFIYLHTGFFDRALDCFEKALALRLTHLGETKPDTMSTYNFLAMVYIEKGDYENALKYNEKALSLRLQVFGKNHIETGNSYYNLGNIKAGKGNNDEALQAYQTALEIYQTLFGEKHEYISNTYCRMGLANYNKGEYKQAMKFYETALAISVELNGEQHPSTAQINNNIGIIYHTEGDYEAALTNFKKVLASHLSILGEKHPDIGHSYNNLGVVCESRFEYDQSLEWHEKALALRLELHGEKHPDTACSYSNIGFTLYRKKEFERAMPYFEKSLAIRLEILGEHHLETAYGYFGVGINYEELGDHDRAMEYQTKALAIRREFLEGNHPEVLMSQHYIACIHTGRKEYETALAIHENVLALRMEIFGEGHPDTNDSILALADLYEKTGNDEKAREFHERIKAQENNSGETP